MSKPTIAQISRFDALDLLDNSATKAAALLDTLSMLLQAMADDKFPAILTTTLVGLQKIADEARAELLENVDKVREVQHAA